MCLYLCAFYRGFPGGTRGKGPVCQCTRHKRWIRSLGREDPLEEDMATHSSILAWRTPWIEEPSRLQSMGLQSQTRWKWLSMHSHTYSANGSTSIHLYTIWPFFFQWTKISDSSALLELPGHNYGPSLQVIHCTDAHDSLKWFPLCRRLSQVFCYNRQACSEHPGTDALVSQHYF